ncbi:uncharacterized protein LOC129230360 [Uloborus diversus]|uniref:uncharacterized protein LOC129218760 n=1 Tax=Uloborus diversus TaxID=327109 RepID=UPI00240A7878|nr:uncharacterized protein LOC129218760 [Uloborus diversus]XP_054720733.1 uncharacterized protein LOC129230360 [Uloborus diversus]
MDLARLKELRKGLRISLTKHLTKIETTLEIEITSDDYSKEDKIDELLSLKSQLLEKLKAVITRDEEIQSKIEIEDMLADIETSEEYKDKVNEMKSKIERHLDILCDRPRAGVGIQMNRRIEQVTVDAEENVQTAAAALNNVSFRSETRNVVKLPKLNIRTFYGDCSYFLDFWNSFEVAVHNNDALSKVEKFTYLKSYLGGVARSAVSGFSLTDQNYDESINLLKERFGRSDIIMSSHMHKLLLVDSVKSCANVIGLRKMYDAIEVQIRSLKSLGVATGTYGNLLCPVILQKLPEELNLSYNRTRKTNELFDITDLVEFIRMEVECRETALILANPKNANMKEYPSQNKINDTGSYGSLEESLKFTRGVTRR